MGLIGEGVRLEGERKEKEKKVGSEVEGLRL